MVLLHGFTDTWRTWDLVLPELERHHDVLAPTLIGHAGGPPLGEEISDQAIVDGVEEAMDAAGFERAHIVGNSLGGYIALQLAARGRAESVVALAPAGGWPPDDAASAGILTFFAEMQAQLRLALPHAEALLSTVDGRRMATSYTVTNFEHIPVELMLHQLEGVVTCDAAPLIEFASREGFDLDAAKIDCPVRIVWGTEDKILGWPATAARYREEWLPNADWVELDGIGHMPQLDVPTETAQLILGFTSD
jgi:pimeloyl-ACP methyl ester carboxylesterase